MGMNRLGIPERKAEGILSGKCYHSLRTSKPLAKKHTGVSTTKPFQGVMCVYIHICVYIYIYNMYVYICIVVQYTTLSLVALNHCHLRAGRACSSKTRPKSCVAIYKIDWVSWLDVPTKHEQRSSHFHVTGTHSNSQASHTCHSPQGVSLFQALPTAAKWLPAQGRSPSI